MSLSRFRSTTATTIYTSEVSISLLALTLPGPDSIGIVAIFHGCTGVAARTCGLVGLEPTRVAEILKDRPSWYRDCRAVDVLNVLF
ncbi:hypothetical protein CsSME_00020744 [Camellia sinensis var. sinensis]